MRPLCAPCPREIPHLARWRMVLGSRDSKPKTILHLGHVLPRGNSPQSNAARQLKGGSSGLRCRRRRLLVAPTAARTTCGCTYAEHRYNDDRCDAPDGLASKRRFSCFHPGAPPGLKGVYGRGRPRDHVRNRLNLERLGEDSARPSPRTPDRPGLRYVGTRTTTDDSDVTARVRRRYQTCSPRGLRGRRIAWSIRGAWRRVCKG
jgi:hypothetical protein